MYRTKPESQNSRKLGKMTATPLNCVLDMISRISLMSDPLYTFIPS